jgi:hypothetical protein
MWFHRFEGIAIRRIVPNGTGRLVDDRVVVIIRSNATKAPINSLPGEEREKIDHSARKRGRDTRSQPQGR